MKPEAIERTTLTAYLERTLDINRFRDYCPNGLQVEGKPQISTIVTGVTASLALLEAAIEAGADAILVHHGYFWRNEDARVIGTKQRRLKLLLQNEINLYAFHLPLDAHPELGNNAQLALRLGFTPEGRFGEGELGWIGRPQAGTLGELAAGIQSVLDRAPLVIGDASRPVQCVAWCTGAAHTMLAEAIAAGADAFISGEISEPVVHLARESGVAYLACGHHATERYGIQAVGEHLAGRFGIEHRFIDIPNPV